MQLVPQLRRLRHLGATLQRRRLVEQIISASDALTTVSDDQLARTSRELIWRASCRLPLQKLLSDAFALVREMCRRVHKQPHFHVQLMAGICLAHGEIVEMQTGEGKTLTALLPAFLCALSGRPVHVVTANDYLARRDAVFAEAVFKLLGFRVGCVWSDLRPEQRPREYACEITYGTSREFGFDFLRDRLAIDETHSKPTSLGKDGVPATIQRGHHFAIIDEADSVLLDDARTPLLIATAQQSDATAEQLNQWCDKVAGELTDGEDFVVHYRTKLVRLTECGCRRVVSMRKPVALDAIDLGRIYARTEDALAARTQLCRDRDYVVDEIGVSLVDPSTGRTAYGRKLRDGLHQAVEVMERLEPSPTLETAAQITVQSFFRRYEFLAGLTGTAMPAAREFQRTYGLPVSRIATRKPCLRKRLPTRIFASLEAKVSAICEDVSQRSRAGQPILVGTPSVAASESLSAALRDRGITHELLNCRFHDREAEIVSVAGQPGRVTIATNMAGRGTDIALPHSVKEIGGLHVICTEMHTNSRIDRQLVGRTARQGDPGSFQTFVSLEDELFEHVSCDWAKQLKNEVHPSVDTELPESWIAWFQKAQRQIQKIHEHQRSQLLRHEQEHGSLCHQMGLDPLLELLRD